VPTFSEDALSGESVVITGATGGIGSSVAETVAATGASILATGRDTDRLDELEERLSEIDASGEIATHQADLTDEAERSELASEAEQVGVTMLVNAAGVTGSRTDFEDLSQQDVEEILDINYLATLRFTQELYSSMKDCSSGAIVNVASLSGLRGTYKSIPYCSSKFALVGFTQSLALEAVEHDIRVNAVCPGWVDTEMGREAIESKAEARGRGSDEQLERELEAIPSKKMSTPSDVANAVVYLLSDGSQNIVGESLKISGGSVLR
jgi:3-oxoacyl-[acyl-carrier protein] reductase